MTDRRLHWSYKLEPDRSGWRYEVKVRVRPWRPWGIRDADRGIHDGPRELAEAFVLERARVLLRRCATGQP